MGKSRARNFLWPPPPPPPFKTGSRGGDLVSTLPGCVCRKVKDMGPFSASSEWNEWHDFTQNVCIICYLTQYGWKISTEIVYHNMKNSNIWSNFTSNTLDLLKTKGYWIKTMNMLCWDQNNHHIWVWSMKEIPSLWVCFKTRRVLQNGSFSKPSTHTSG